MVSTYRAAGNTYEAENFTGGTRSTDSVMRDLSEYMEAPERADTPFLDSLDKGPVGTQRKKEWGVKAVNPRGSLVGSGGIDSNAATATLPVTAGHGVRFQQYHVIWVESASDPAIYEIMWISATPSANALTVKREQGGTTATAFSAGAIIRAIGIAVPQLVDFQVGPLSRGSLWYNYYQKFETLVSVSDEDMNTDSYEYQGNQLDIDATRKMRDMKEEFEHALIRGQRQAGDINTPLSPMLSGVLHLTTLSGNVLNVGGTTTPLSLDAIEEAASNLDDAVGSNAGKKLLMSLNTKRIINRLLNNNRQLTATDTRVAQKFEVAELETGDYTFEHSRNMPDNVVLLYDPGLMQYHPYKGMDWREKDVETAGTYEKRGISGSFTFTIDTPQCNYLINNFDTTLSNYPQIGI